MAKLLQGEVMPTADPEVERLRTENRRLQREVEDARRDEQRAREDADRALRMLRQQLSPLYRALQAVFGELDAAGVSDEAPAAVPAGAPPPPNGRDAREMALWADWKQKLPVICGRVIDVLLLHNDLSVKQIRAAAKMAEGSVYQATSRLGQLGLITKSDGRFSLKQL